MNVKLIKNYIKSHDLSKKDFCKKCGISIYKLNRILINKPVKLTVILKLVNLLNCSAKDLLGI